MRYSAVAGRYARALLNVAMDRGEEERYRELLKVVNVVYKKFRAFFDDPSTTSQKKHNFMLELLKDLKVEIDEPFVNFLRLLFERKRQKYLPLILEVYADLEIEAKGMIPVDVLAPYELSEEEKEVLRKFVKKVALREPVFRLKKDESLLAGVRLEFQGMSYDVSVKGRIERIYRDVFGEGVM